MARPTTSNRHRATSALSSRLRRFILEKELILKGERVLAAVSGGPDSTCLLLLLAGLRGPLGFELETAHFNHGLRGKQDAAAERGFVEDLCRSLDVPLHTEAGDVRLFARRSKRSIEDAARALRYEFLAGVAAKHHCHAVATGHTKDDQAETVLLHLIRGSGLRGLTGMAVAGPLPLDGRATTDIRLVRPLLSLSRRDTERCCRDAGLTPIDDASNRSSAFTRNRVRQQLLPALRTFNPQIEDALAGLAETASADDAALEALARALVSERKDGAAIDRQSLRLAPTALRARAVQVAFASVAGDQRDLGRRHVEAVLRAAGSTGATLDLPRGVAVEVRRSLVLFRPCASGPRALPPRTVTLAVPGAARLGDWRFEAHVVATPTKGSLNRGPLEAHLDVDVCAPKLLVRKRRLGDRFQPLGMSGEKKLQDFLVDAHVPRSERDATPLVCASGRIAWVAGQRPAEWAKVRSGARRAVRVRADRAEK